MASERPTSATGARRLRTKRQERIVSMVDGYCSTESLASGVSNALLVWIVLGVAMVVLGVTGLASSAVPNERWLRAITFSSALLWILTVLVGIIWAVRAWANVERLGKLARLDIWALVRRHWGFVALALMFTGLSLVESLRSISVPGAILFGLLGVSAIPLAILEALRLLWRSGSLPLGANQDLPAFGYTWFASWLVFSCLLLFDSLLPGGATVRSFWLVVAGGCCLAASVTGAQMVRNVSYRHDLRLATIVSSFDLGDSIERAEVTAEQIESAWADSETLVSFDSASG